MIKHKGYLAIIAVLLILVIGFIGTTIIALYTGSASALVNYHQGEQALYIAESGLEEAGRLLQTPNLSGSNARIACSAITGNANLTNVTIDNGTFLATTGASNPTYARSTLSSAITESATTIAVASTAGFATAGLIQVDREIIKYNGISGNSFIAVTRGIGNNNNTTHASGTPVSQYQCMVDLDGGIPNVSSANFKRNIQGSFPLQEAWAVGASTGANFSLTRWNRATELTWNNSTFGSGIATGLNSISMLSNGDGFAVANSTNGFTFLRWNGTSWATSTITAPCTNSNLLGVSAISANEAYAVGIRYRNNNSCSSGGQQRYNVVKWNGSTWTILTPSTSPSIPADAGANQTLNSVHVIDDNNSGVATIGFAVGLNGQILRYNGSNWVSQTSPTSNALNHVFVVSASQAWAVGASGTIIRWNGSTWSTFSSPTSTALNSVYMVDSTGNGTADYGWAVGDSGVCLFYNGTSWSTQSSGVGNNLADVAAFNSNDAWAVGTSGLILHWNGSSWASVTSNVVVPLQSISLIVPYPTLVGWQEIYA